MTAIIGGSAVLAYGVWLAANYMVWFYTLGPGLANAVAHLYFPIAAGRSYFPGLVTVALPTVCGLIVLARLLRPSGKTLEDSTAPSISA